MNVFLWVKAWHIIAVVCWFAGLFYLPRLFVYHAEAQDALSHERFKIMERRLFYGIMTPSAIATIGLGGWLLSFNWSYYMRAHWMHAKLGLVLFLVAYHIFCGTYVYAFAFHRNVHSSTFYRFFNEAPVLALIGIIILVVVKPF